MIKYGLLACLMVSFSLLAMDGQQKKKRSTAESISPKIISTSSSEDIVKRLKVLEHDIQFKTMYRLENRNKRYTGPEKKLIDQICEVRDERNILEAGSLGFALMGARKSIAQEISALEDKSCVLYEELKDLSAENDSSAEAAIMSRAVSIFMQEMMQVGLSFNSAKQMFIRVDND